MTTRVRTKRINARLSDDVARKLSYLERRTHMTTTDVVRESIERYYAAVSRDGEPGPRSPASSAARTGLKTCPRATSAR
ncbi:MAG: ribbon-helix-helix protein, CopG family [Polyangiaceae bacterium]|nr:ribbon-helix-helix protein, CopG family [Polyangiaceae bacterium]